MTDTPSVAGAGLDAAPPRPASSLVLVRDSSTGIEALLLQRPAEDRVLSGAMVFPGGKLDDEDAAEALLARVDEAPDRLHARLGESELEAREAAALYVAALREAFEETGVLMARGTHQALSERARGMRREGMGFIEVLEALDLRLDPSIMHPWSRWVTPKVPSSAMRRRFDTRFFLAALPEGQTVEHDPREAVAAAWVQPRQALQRYWEREIDMAPPQIMTLAHLSRFKSVAAAMADAATRRPPVIRPQPIETEDGRMICYPGDPQHPIAERAMPGPTRLLIRNGRFLPEDGFDAWFA